MQHHKKRLSDSQIIEALKEHRGIIKYAAKALGVPRSTIYRRIQKSQKLKEAFNEAREDLIDEVENALIWKAILEGDITAIIFLLKTIGKHRGYGEKREMEK